MLEGHPIRETESYESLDKCVNLPDFIIESLSIALKMHTTQAAALLTQNQKFLVHICTKGMKGKDYSKLKAWYKLLLKQIPNFISQCE